MLKYIIHYQKASKDIVYFVENFLGVTLYPFQKAILWSMVEEKRLLVNACRQSGKTSCIIWYSIWKALFRPDSTIAILGMTADSNHRIIESIKKVIGEEYKELIKQSDKMTVSINDSQIVTFIPNNYRDYIKGRRISDFLWDEMAYSRYDITTPKEMETFSNLTDANYHIFSTKRADDDYFYKKYVESKHPLLNTSGFKSITVNWWDISEQDYRWREMMRRLIGEKMFNVEYLSDF